jgi:hypothetical protein
MLVTSFVGYSFNGDSYPTENYRIKGTGTIKVLRDPFPGKASRHAAPEGRLAKN